MKMKPRDILKNMNDMSELVTRRAIAGELPVEYALGTIDVCAEVAEWLEIRASAHVTPRIRARAVAIREAVRSR